MRKIKFRAWDSANAKMVRVGQLTNDYCDGDKLIYFDYPLMQYTGLKDKNGKEIYEGDVLKYAVSKSEDELYGDVKYRFAGYIIDCFQDGYISLSHTQNKEVIGNIYSNPELLEKVKDDD